MKIIFSSGTGRREICETVHNGKLFISKTFDYLVTFGR